MKDIVDTDQLRQKSSKGKAILIIGTALVLVFGFFVYFVVNGGATKKADKFLGLSPGMTNSEVISIKGMPNKKFANNAWGYIDGDKLDIVQFHDKQVSAVLMMSGIKKEMCFSDIYITESEESLLKKYGQPTTEKTYKDGSKLYMFNKYKVLFNIVNGKVTSCGIYSDLFIPWE